MKPDKELPIRFTSAEQVHADHTAHRLIVLGILVTLAVGNLFMQFYWR